MNCTLFIPLNHSVSSTLRKKILLVIIWLLCISFCKAQHREENQFIKSYLDQSFFNKLEKFIYVKGLSRFEIEDIRKSVVKDTIFSTGYKNSRTYNLLIINSLEREEINNQLDSLNSSEWYKSLHLENSQAIPHDSIDVIFAHNLDVGWAFFYKKYGSRFHHFSRPILFRNNTLCLFYFSYYCSPFCGEGYIMVFRKEQDNWVKWLTLHGWGS